ncbi:MAG: HNH endonuclease [Cetobacterium sp.]
MRPVNKGDSPRVYKDYKDAKWDLIEKLGEYCSYCEMNISNQADVEHVVPKSKDGYLELDWGNFLLGCKTCNTIKSNINDDRDGYPFPDEYNTAYLYNYKNGNVKVNENLSVKDKLKAENLFQLIKANRQYNTTGRLDDRKMARIKEYEKAMMSLNDYKEYPVQVMINQISRSPSGFHSVWIEVFKDYPKVKKAILEGVPGTALECYDEEFNPIEKLER